MYLLPALALLGCVWQMGFVASSSVSPPQVHVINAYGLSVDIVEHDSITWPDMSDPKMAEQVLQEELEASARASVPNLSCPAACSEVGSDPANWPVFSHPVRLSACNETMLLDLAVFADIKDKNAKISIRACTADLAASSPHPRVKGRRAEEECAPILQVQTTSPIRVAPKGSLQLRASSPSGQEDLVLAAARQISHYSNQVTPATCYNNTVSFAHAGKIVMGFYGGAQLHRQGLSSKLLDASWSTCRVKGRQAPSWLSSAIMTRIGALITSWA